MKSSSSLKLTLMMGATATLASCSEPPQSFASVAECIKYGKPQALCRSAYGEAFAEHIKSAPSFASEDECRAKIDVDRCISTPVKGSDGTTRNAIVPAMAGYVIGKNLPGKRKEERTSSVGYAYNGGIYRGTPLYRSHKDEDGFWRSFELEMSKNSVRPPNVRSHTFARGGFGGRISFGGS